MHYSKIKQFVQKLLTKNKKVPSGVSVKDVYALLEQEEIHLLDVRSKEEYDDGHAQGAINIPLVNVRSAKLPLGKDIFFICRTGARGLRACEILTEFGIASKHTEGGTTAWKKAGLSIKKNTSKKTK